MAPVTHPFDPLSPQEIATAAAVTRESFRGKYVLFRVVTLAEPPKWEMTAFLDLEYASKVAAPPKRTAKVQVYVDKTFHELMIDVNEAIIDSNEILEGKHAFSDSAHIKSAEEACLRDDRVKAEIEALQLPDGATVIVEGWTYAPDGMNDMSTRITMVRHTSDHLEPKVDGYSAGFTCGCLIIQTQTTMHPLDIVAEVSESLEVSKVYRPPSGEADSDATIRTYDHNKLHTSSEYHPDLSTSHRTTTRLLHVTQPEGPSFTIDGNQIAWEKWTMRLGFNYREGMTLHDVRYDNRSLFYRLSLSEMFVPYGDPRTPYPRKGAFDVGNDGAGVNANNLKLGCDCLGHIKYFDAWHVTASGEPMKLPNVVCCHEQDDGILWKHTNFRTGNAVVTRSRLLVLQTIITVSNYEYIFLFYFSQDASLHYEVRATGILSTVPIDHPPTTLPYATTVAPGVLAPFHQHLFCLRIDPAIDGPKNTLVVEESAPMPFPHPSNPHGVGYTTTTTPIDEEQGLDLDHRTNRVFKIINEAAINPTTGSPVGFKLLPCYSQMLLAHPSSHHARRSEFGAHAVWVTRYSDSELYAAGTHTMQSAGGEGIASWIRGRRRERVALGSEDASRVRHRDIVVWHTFGSTHNPRVEDWPVMSAEKMVVGLKPVNFFEGNPGLDVPVSTQERNESVLVGGKGSDRSRL